MKAIHLTAYGNPAQNRQMVEVAEPNAPIVGEALPDCIGKGCRPRLLPRRADDLPDGRTLRRRRCGRLSRR